MYSRDELQQESASDNSVYEPLVEIQVEKQEEDAAECVEGSGSPAISKSNGHDNQNLLAKSQNMSSCDDVNADKIAEKACLSDDTESDQLNCDNTKAQMKNDGLLSNASKKKHTSKKICKSDIIKKEVLKGTHDVDTILSIDESSIPSDLKDDIELMKLPKIDLKKQHDNKRNLKSKEDSKEDIIRELKNLHENLEVTNIDKQTTANEFSNPAVRLKSQNNENLSRQVETTPNKQSIGANFGTLDGNTQMTNAEEVIDSILEPGTANDESVSLSKKEVFTENPSLKETNSRIQNIEMKIDSTTIPSEIPKKSVND